MSFGENLKTIRKEKHLSQEELAELLEVSRQSVSKWEQDAGYPEAEKLILLSRKLNVSLDALLETGFAPAPVSAEISFHGSIVITSPHENVITECCKVSSSGRMHGGEDEPKYALFGTAKGLSSFWGEPNTFLGWYADEDTLTREIRCIQDCLRRGIPHYELQYSVKTQRKWLKIKIKPEENEG